MRNFKKASPKTTVRSVYYSAFHDTHQYNEVVDEMMRRYLLRSGFRIQISVTNDYSGVNYGYPLSS